MTFRKPNLSITQDLALASVLFGLFLSAWPSPAATMETPSGPVNPPSPAQKWLTEAAAQFQTSYEKNVLGPYNEGLENARKQYQTTLESALQKASLTGRGSEAELLRKEREGFFSSGRMLPSESTALPLIETARTGFRAQIASLINIRIENARKLHAKFDASLAQNIPLLKNRQLNEDAALLEAKREQIKREWLESPPMVPTDVSNGGSLMKTTRIPLRESVQWLLKQGGKILISSGKKATPLRDARHLSSGRPEFALVALRNNVGSAADDPEGNQITDQDMDNLASLRGAQKLSLPGWSFNDRAFGFLEEWHELEQFDASRLQVTEKLAGRLARFPMLRSVHVGMSETVTAEFVRLLSPTTSKLESLRLPKTGVGDSAVEHLLGFKRLTSLDLSGTRLTNEGLKRLAGIKTLKELDVRDTKVTATGLQCLSDLRLNSLGMLSTDSPTFSSDATQVSRTFPSVECLTLSGTEFRPDHAEALKAFSKLRLLVLKTPKPTPEALSALQKLAGLEEFQCSSNEFGDPEIKSLSKIKHLKKICLSGTAVTNTGLMELAHCRGLKELNISGTAITEAAAETLEKQSHGLHVIH
jgi:internalin A